MNRDYKCRYGSTCSIGRSAENLKQVCQACRFNQCIQAGMKMDCKLSMNDEGRAGVCEIVGEREREGRREAPSLPLIYM